MTALDTNVLARLVLRDDPEQEARAEALLAAGPCWVGATVMLETAWVLRTAGKLSDPTIAAELRLLMQITSLSFEESDRLDQALDDAEAGMDLADAFHRAFAGAATRLATFDRRFVRAADGRPGLPVDLL